MIKFIFGIAAGMLIMHGCCNQAYACEKCDEIRNWAYNEVYQLSCELYDLQDDSLYYHYVLGKADSLVEVIQMTKQKDQQTNSPENQE